MSFQTVTMTLLDGFLLNIELFAVTLVLSLPLGLVVSFGTMSRFKPLSLLVRLYVYIMRSTPLMLQLAVVFYLPGIVFGPGHSLGRMGAAVLAFVLNYAAYFSEIFRGGIQGVPATQRESEVRKKRLHFGLVFQSFNLFPQYTALENVTLAGQLLARERPDFKGEKKRIFAEIEEKGRTLLAQMGLADRAGHYPHQLSGGQQQRVAIARALALSPDILCFDEPTSALDPELTGEVLRVIRALAEQKTTMIIVTHEMAFARDVADQVVFMDGGVIVEQGDARQVIEHPREERTRQFLARYSEN